MKISMLVRCRVIAKVFEWGLALIIIYDQFLKTGSRYLPSNFFFTLPDAYIMGELYRIF